MFKKIKIDLILLISILVFLSTNCNKTEYRYYRDGKVEIKEVSNKKGLILWQHFSDSGKLLSENHYLNGKKHGRCA